MLGYSQSTLQLFTQANLRPPQSTTQKESPVKLKKKFTSCYDEGYDLKGDEFYTVWAKLKQLSLCYESETKNDDDDKHEILKQLASPHSRLATSAILPIW